MLKALPRGEPTAAPESGLQKPIRDVYKRQVLEVGDKALAMVGRTPNYISAIFPLKDGVISDHTMTRDGLMVENQADGTVENVSSREAEQDYSTAVSYTHLPCSSAGFSSLPLPSS